MEKINKNYDKKYFFGYHDALKIYEAPKLRTETTVSNPPVVIPNPAATSMYSEARELANLSTLLTSNFFVGYFVSLKGNAL